MRIATAVVGIPLFVWLTWLGGWPFVALALVIGVGGQIELFGLMRRTEMDAGGWAALVAGAALVTVPAWPDAVFLAAAASLVALGRFALRPAAPGMLGAAAGTGFGILYPAALVAPLVALRLQLPESVDAFRVTLGVVVLIWVADSAAYDVGRGLGRHLLAPTVSPKKTWEGYAGGVVGGVAAAAAIGIWAATGLGIVHWIVLGTLVSVIGPAGDLFESALKRASGVKDSSGLLPGHGGLLDRFDALFFVAPVAWIYLGLVI